MSDFKIDILWSDMLFFILLALVLLGIGAALRREHLRRAWRGVFASPGAMVAATLLVAVLGVTLLDCLHFRPALPGATAQTPAAQRYSVEVVSVFDVAVGGLRTGKEKTYSEPLAYQLYEKQPVRLPDGRQIRDYPRLAYGSAHLSDPAHTRWSDVARRAATGLAVALGIWALLAAGTARLVGRSQQLGLRDATRRLLRGQTAIAWDAMLWTLLALLVIFVPLGLLAQHYHVFGTDQVGNDVFFQALKSLRTALLIGTLATLVELPLGIGLGLCAGYFGGWVDDVIQYIYTVISSIPYVLLIAAAVLMMQVVIETHPALFDTAAARADARLVSLCVIIGGIGWTHLCRLIRAETLKLRELEYVQAARSFGVSSVRIMLRHILPNAFHLVLINTVLEFSSLVLAEAVLSYVGVGVDSTTISFGTMINSARSELARDPVVWWSISAAFVFMVSLVLAANLFADGMRDAFDPRAQNAVRRRQLAGGRA